MMLQHFLSRSSFLPILSFTVILLGQLAASAPLTAEPFTATSSSNETNTLVNRTTITAEILAGAKKSFPRIDWDFAVGDCTGDQFLILLEATKVGLEMLDSSGDWATDVWNSPGFNRYFVKDDWWRSDAAGLDWIYASRVYTKSRRWLIDAPVTGNGVPTDKRAYKTRYVCQPEKVNYNDCNERPKTPAFTATRDKNKENNCAACHSIYFCPIYFTSRLPNMNSLISKGYRPASDIIGLETREHVMVHEWQHNPKIDEATFHIADQRGLVPSVGKEVPIYGAALCAEFAWMDYDKWPGHVKYPVLRNADSYAWMVSYNYFTKMFCWSGDGQPTKRDLLLLSDGFDKRQDNTTDVGTTPGSGGQMIGIAAYSSPSEDADAWTRMTNYDLGKLSVLVVNALNGPDNSVNTAWENVINNAAGAGKTVIGYVRTGYLGQSTFGFTTRLGSNELADWVSQIEMDVDLWYSLYPGKIGGIFFDEGWNSCGTDNQFSELYRLITENTKRKHPGAFTVLNPGATMPQCFEDSADTLMTFESSYEAYTSSYVPNGWTASSTQKIWHIIYNVPSSAVATVVALAKERGAGYVQITDDTLPNPYDTLPNDAYMQTLLGAVEGGTVRVFEPTAFVSEPAAPAPSGLEVTATDYSSVSLSWSASSNAVSYKVYVNGVANLNLASYMTAVTVGNLAVGTSGFSFQISAVGGGGAESSLSGAVTASTNSPAEAGKYITNANVSTSASSSVYEADILIPYAYVRLYITYTVNGGCAAASWTINYSSDNYVCAVAMVDSGTLYRYSGTDERVPTWSWTNLGAVTVIQDHYHFTWNVPLGTDNLTTGNFVIQTEGYGPLLNYLQPCPLFAEGDTYCSGQFAGT